MCITNHKQVCKRCVMDTSAPNIKFDTRGYCNFCTYFEDKINNIVFSPVNEREKKKDDFVSKVKESGKGKKYDCIVGVSGGVDSSYVLHKAVSEGLRPLAVHMDNNWNSELAVNNIKNLVSALKVDLYTHVIDWPEYKKLMQGFFDADVIDVELLYDNAMLAVNYQQARKYGIKYILSGSNSATEGIPMPHGWNWYKWDKRNIKFLGKSAGVKIKSFPSVSFVDYLFNRFAFGITWASFLDFYDYKKDEALNILEADYGYKRYPYKHYESVFTRFYQGFLLPEKFGVDKRKLHLSTLIMSNQISREAALKVLEGIPYDSIDGLARDKAFFLKKMGWTQTELQDYIARPPKSHADFPNDKQVWDLIRNLYMKFK